MEENGGGSPDRLDGGLGDSSARRPSLTERLMNPPKEGPSSSGVDRVGSQPRQEAAMTLPAPPSEPRNTAPSAEDGVSHQAALVSFRSTSNPALSQSLSEARKMMRLRYFAFLGSIGILFVTLIVGAIMLAVFLLSDARWQEQAASGAVAGGALLLLLLIQYRPVAGFASAAAEIAQLDALSAHLQKSYALWDGFLEERASAQQVGANEVALAVSSMTAATREVIALQTELLEARRGSQRTDQVHRRSFPTPTSPDPRRY